MGSAGNKFSGSLHLHLTIKGMAMICIVAFRVCVCVGGGYSDFCLLHGGLGLLFGFKILNLAIIWVSRFCQLFLWVCQDLL